MSTCPVTPGLRHFLAEADAVYDVIHFHGVWPTAELLDLFAQRRRARRVVTYHANVLGREPINTFYKPFLRGFLRRCDAVIATSAAYARSSPVLAGLPEKPRVIPIGLDPSTYPAADPDRVAAWRARVEPGPVFVFVGALRRYKGLTTLVEAATGLAGQVVVAGTGASEPAIRAAIRARGLTNVHLPGRVCPADKAALYALAQAVVLPSITRAEAFGITLLEGALYGRALVAVEVGPGTTLVNAHGETGLVVPPGEPDRLREALEALTDADLAARFGAAAHRRFERLFHAKRIAHQYAAAYQGPEEAIEGDARPSDLAVEVSS